eukprot:gene11749-8079_t
MNRHHYQKTNCKNYPDMHHHERLREISFSPPSPLSLSLPYRSFSLSWLSTPFVILKRVHTKKAVANQTRQKKKTPNFNLHEERTQRIMWLRRSAIHLGRTSRRHGSGSWSHPSIRGSGVSEGAPQGFARRGAGMPAHGGHPPNPNTIDAADNPIAYGMAENPYRNNWKAAAPMPGHFSYADFQQHVEKVREERGRSGRFGGKESSSSSSSSSRPGGDEANAFHSSHHGTASAGRGSWRGDDPNGGSATEGNGTLLFRRGRPKTLTELCRHLMDAAFEPRASDSTMYGGDGATERAQRKEELKHLDPRITPIFHEDMMQDRLRSVRTIRTPSGALCPNGREALLKGRLVGLLFFSESERSMAFMRLLSRFHQLHHPDLIIAAVSLANTEMLSATRGLGFYHITHRDGGATWVQRDVGLELKLLVPLPRLLIVDGSTGREISRRGVTEVVAHPEECMKWWRAGESGCSVWDYCRTWYLTDDPYNTGSVTNDTAKDHRAPSPLLHPPLVFLLFWCVLLVWGCLWQEKSRPRGREHFIFFSFFFAGLHILPHPTTGTDYSTVPPVCPPPHTPQKQRKKRKEKDNSCVKQQLEERKGEPFTDKQNTRYTKHNIDAHTGSEHVRTLKEWRQGVSSPTNHPPMGCGCSSSKDTADSNRESPKPNQKVAPFENGKPDVEYQEIYGCFREEEVTSSDDDDEDLSREERRKREKRRQKERKERREKNKKALPGKLYRLVQVDENDCVEDSNNGRRSSSAAASRHSQHDGDDASRSRELNATSGSPHPSRPHPPQRWYFYNDTLDYNMAVTGYFGPMNELTANGKTRMWREMPSGLIIAELIIEPLETEAYMEGRIVDGFDLRFKALPKGEHSSHRRRRRNHNRHDDDDNNEDDSFCVGMHAEQTSTNTGDQSGGRLKEEVHSALARHPLCPHGTFLRFLKKK